MDVERDVEGGILFGLDDGDEEMQDPTGMLTYHSSSSAAVSSSNHSADDIFADPPAPVNSPGSPAVAVLDAINMDQNALEGGLNVADRVVGRDVVRVALERDYEWFSPPPDFSEPGAKSLDCYIHLAVRRMNETLVDLGVDHYLTRRTIIEEVVYLRSLKREKCAVPVRGCCVAGLAWIAAWDYVEASNTYVSVFCNRAGCHFDFHSHENWEYTVIFKSIDNAVYHAMCNVDYKNRGNHQGMVDAVTAANYSRNNVYLFDPDYFVHIPVMRDRLCQTTHLYCHM